MRWPGRGGTITTLNPTYSEQDVRHQLNDSAAELLVTVPDFLPVAQAAIKGTRVQKIVVIGQADGVTGLSDLMGPLQPAQTPVDLQRHVLVLPFSSGTTGLPKGVMLSHYNLAANIDQGLALINVKRSKLTVAFLPFFRIYGMNVTMNLFLAAGATHS